MTLFHSHSAGLPVGSEGRSAIATATAWLAAAFKAVHHAILAAKLRRLQSELMLRGGWVARADIDVGKLPRYPLNPGDKWDD